MKYVRTLGVTALAAIGAVIAVSQISAASTGNHDAQQARVASTSNAWKAEQHPESVGLPEGLEKRGIHVTKTGDATESEAAMARKAIEVGFGGFLNDDAGSTEEVVFTDDNYGPEDPESGVVTPTYVNTPALMIVMERQPVPLLGGYSKSSNLPDSAEANFVAFVDPKSGQVLRAVAFNDDGILKVR